MAGAAREAHTVGVEEELLLVDAGTHALVPVAATVLAALGAPADEAGHEAYAAELELRSPPGTASEDAVRALEGLRERAGEAADTAAGTALVGAGLHPAAAHGEATHVQEERYSRLDGVLRGVVRRAPECALHVHVAMPDLDGVIRALNGLRGSLPLLRGLAANSPWWFGVDSGLASARGAVVSAYPGRGIPRPFRDAADWEEAAAAAVSASELDDSSFLWWDVRPSVKHCTVEVREMDAQASLDAVLALVALVRALAVEAAAGEGPVLTCPPPEALEWSAFRAQRDGVQARILDGAELRPLAAVARETVERLRPVAQELGDEEALLAVADILRSGGGAERRRAAQARGGLPSQLRDLVEETARPLGGARPPDARAGVTGS